MDGTPSRHRILSLSVIGGFLDGLELSFGQGLNTIIGARGTGKTTAIEFIGYALDCLPSREHAADERKRIETLVKRNLGGGRIHVGIQAADGVQYTVTRSFGDEPIVLDAQGEPVSVNLKSGLFRADPDPLIDRSELNADQAGKVLATLFDPEFLFLLETVELDDQPLVELRDGEDYKETSALSTGQKCTTILPILLLESGGTLIVDQPEDNLDNRFIFQTIVESIRHVKQQRQLILVTHNPNIPVLGEADHVVVLESDGARARVTRHGNVDRCKQEIVTLLEGGAEAFRRRGERYGQ